MLRKRIVEGLASHLTPSEAKRLVSLYRLLLLCAGTLFTTSSIVGGALFLQGSRERMAHALLALSSREQFVLTGLVWFSFLLPAYCLFYAVCKWGDIEGLVDESGLGWTHAPWLQMTLFFGFWALLMGFWSGLGFADL